MRLEDRHFAAWYRKWRAASLAESPSAGPGVGRLEQLRRALLTHKVLFLRDQHLDHAAQVAFGEMHRVLTVPAEGVVAVHGSFTGTLRDGSHVAVRFADFFEISDEGRFRRRDTFFFAPSV